MWNHISSLLIIIETLIIVALASPPNPALKLPPPELGHGPNSRSSFISRSIKQQIDTDREYLLKDAISWMTLRMNGKLISEMELQSLLGYVRDKYIQSNFYKTFVIAFQQGILPKLKLNEGDACDSNYISSYRDPHNYSVTYYYQKKFIFDDFNKVTNFPAYCDYRQGLVCNPNSNKCECPSGSKMENVDFTSPQLVAKRCMVQENQVCALIDLSHSSKNDALLHHLPLAIFNLERPLSCKPGTQCRFKNMLSPKCYSNTDTFQTYQGDESFDKKDGMECTLNLIAEPGMCEEKTGQRKERGPNGYICYNYWGKEGYSNKTGFCANEYGPFGEIPDNPYPQYKAYHPFLAYFGNPKTTSLKEEKLHEHQRKLLKVYTDYILADNIIQFRPNGTCSVSKTNKMLEIYKFYEGLTGEKRTDEATLNKMLQDLKALTEDNIYGDKLCNIIWRFDWDSASAELVTTMPAICEGPTEGSGNNGHCKESSDNVGGLAVNQLIEANIDRLVQIEKELMKEEETYDATILERFPEMIKEIVPGGGPSGPVSVGPSGPVSVRPSGPSEPGDSESLLQLVTAGALEATHSNLLFVTIAQGIILCLAC